MDLTASYWGEPAKEFDAIGKGVDEEDRFRRVVGEHCFNETISSFQVTDFS